MSFWRSRSTRTRLKWSTSEDDWTRCCSPGSSICTSDTLIYNVAVILMGINWSGHTVVNICMSMNVQLNRTYRCQCHCFGDSCKVDRHSGGSVKAVYCSVVQFCEIAGTMAGFSKYFNEMIKGHTCQDMIHPWTESCRTGFWHYFNNYSLEGAKFFAPAIFVSADDVNKWSSTDLFNQLINCTSIRYPW